MRCALLSLLVFAFLGACDSQEYAQCNAPDDHLEVLYKAKNPVHPFSHPFCLVCNTEIETDEYASWAESMGGSGDISSPEGLHPCLYVYGEGADIPSLEACQALVVKLRPSRRAQTLGTKQAALWPAEVLRDAVDEGSNPWLPC